MKNEQKVIDSQKDVALITREKEQKSKQSTKFKNFKEKSVDGIIKVGSSVGNNRFLVAIRDAFMLPFTLTTGAAIPLILSNMFFSSTSMITAIPGVKDSEGMYWVDLIIGQPLGNVFWAVMAGFSIYLALGMGYFLAKSYGKDGVIAASLSVAIFFAIKPLEGLNGIQIKDGIEQPIAIATNYLGNNGMLIALLASMLGTYMYVKLMDVKWLVPKLPESVPPMVAKAFGAIFVAAIVLTTFTFTAQIWFIIADKTNLTVSTITTIQEGDKFVEVTTIKPLTTIFVALESALSEPLKALGSNIGTTVLISFLVAFFWFFGIHGTNILTPVTSIIWDAQVLKNTEYWVKWKDLHNTSPDLYSNYWKDVIEVGGQNQAGLLPVPMAGLGYVGGTGATLGFLIAILIFSTYKVHREIAKLSIVPGAFGINEPVNFGIPIVLNPVYFIPYVFGFTLTYTTGHLWILIHWIRPGVVWTPSMPYGINILFATDFDWWSLLAALVQLALAFLVWLPFVFIGPKYQEKIEQKAREKAEAKAAARKAEKELKVIENQPTETKKTENQNIQPVLDAKTKSSPKNIQSTKKNQPINAKKTTSVKNSSSNKKTSTSNSSKSTTAKKPNVGKKIE